MIQFDYIEKTYPVSAYAAVLFIWIRNWELQFYISMSYISFIKQLRQGSVGGG